MKAFFFVIALLFSSLVLAERFQVQVDSIDEGQNGQPHLILMSDGQVGFLNASDTRSLDDLKGVRDSKETVEIELNRTNKVLSMRSVAPALEKEGGSDFEEKNMSLAMAYDPSVVSLATGAEVFSKMRRNYQNNSQCYNRAHIWTYEEYRRSGLQSLKVFMFFTRRYIRNYNYHWWFHVTPVVQTPEGMRTLDRRYTKELLTLRTWSNIFVRSNRACPIVNRYNDYRNNQQTEDCYHIPVSMYFWQPWEIERRDRTGQGKNSYIQSQVNHAYWEAF